MTHVTCSIMLSSEPGKANWHNCVSRSFTNGVPTTVSGSAPSRSEMYFRSRRRNGKPNTWSPCTCVMNTVRRSAMFMPYRRSPASAVGGASMMCCWSTMANEWCRPWGRKAFPVPSMSMRGAMTLGVPAPSCSHRLVRFGAGMRGHTKDDIATFGAKINPRGMR